MTNDIKGKNQPIEDQMKESLGRTIEIRMIITVLMYIETIIGFLILIGLIIALHFWNYTSEQITNTAYIGVGILSGIIGITMLIAILWNRKMLKEYE